MKRYPTYKDSGIEWIGKIPVHWQKRRVKSVMDYIVNGIWGEDPVGDKNDIVCVRVADFDMSKLGISKENLTQRNINMSQQNNRMLSQNDILIEKSGGGEKQTVGRVISIDIDEKAVCSNFVGKIAIKSDEIIPRFGTYLFFSMYAIGLNQKAIKQTTGIQNLDTDNYFNEYFYTPSFQEQKDISEFLDRKTAQIDDLIAKKERMIELLREERTAVINQAVTKGLDPKVKMKDSDIEWLGKIPKHWQIKKIKYLVNGKLEYGANEIAELEEPELPRYIRITDFDEGGNLREDTFRSLTDEQAKDYLLCEGDVLFARSGATVGKTFQFKDYAGKACFAGYLIKARPNEEILLSDFLYYYTKSNAYENWKNSIFNQATIQNIGADKYSVLPLPLPSVAEQKRIVDFIIAKCKRIDVIISRGQQSLDLLIEFRTALISEVVTGKIDVRT